MNTFSHPSLTLISHLQTTVSLIDQWQQLVNSAPDDELFAANDKRLREQIKTMLHAILFCLDHY